MISDLCFSNFQRLSHPSWVVMLSVCDSMLSTNSRENSHSEVMLQVIIAEVKLTLLRINMDYQLNNLAELSVIT